MADGKAARFFAKVYSPTGAAFRRVIDWKLLKNIPKIVREVGKPASDVTLDLALPWDNFGYGDAAGINLFDLVKIYAVNTANPTGLLVFQGHIEEITGTKAGDTDTVSLRIFPLEALLNRALYKFGGSYTITYTSADPDTMFSDVIDDVNTIFGATFFTKNLGNPGLSVNAQFVKLSHLAIMQKAAEFLTSTWYWRTRASGQIDLAQFNDSTQDHTLYLGKNVSAVEATKTIMDLKNRIVLTWGPGPTDSEYNDATSESNYGRRMDAETDTTITNAAGADARGNADVARQKDIKTKTVLTVNANYAIETIKPGDTVKVLNVSQNTSQMLTGVLRIVRVEYDGATAVIHLADVADNFGKEFGLAIS